MLYNFWMKFYFEVTPSNTQDKIINLMIKVMDRVSRNRITLNIHKRDKLPYSYMVAKIKTKLN